MLLALEGIAGAGKSTLRDHVLTSAADEGIRIGHIGQFSWLSLTATRTIIGMRAGHPAPAAEQALAAVRADLELHARYNLAPALSAGPVIADRLTLSTVCLLALLHHHPVADYVRQLAEVTAARADLTVLLTTPTDVCHTRLSGRTTERRFGEELPTADRLTDLFDQAATAWTRCTGLPVLRHPCTTDNDLDALTVDCLARLRTANAASARISRT
jgi:dTMP kinase